MNARLAALSALALLQLAGCGGSSAPLSGGDPGSTPGAATLVTAPVTFTASDGAQLRAYVSGAGDFRPRPLIVEFSPYAPTSFSGQFSAPAAFGNSFGPAYNYVEVNARGTGQSSGAWGPVGPRDQQDVAEFLAWACTQPWSNGHIGLYGFSASAIIVYNSLHLPLACVDAAALMSGTNDLYRDLLYPGGILNLAPAIVVGASVGLPLLADFPPAFFEGRPIPDMLYTGLGQIGIYFNILAGHPTEDDFWRQRAMRPLPGPNHFPVLADGSFYDPEPRGAFESVRQLRAAGVPARLITYGAHDGFPANTLGPFPEFKRWLDHYLLGADNGAEREPAVTLLLGNGGHDAFSNGDNTTLTGDGWPLPGTHWQPLFLDPARSGSAVSANDGSLSGAAPQQAATQPYLDLASLPTATDPTTWTVAAAGAASLFDALPLLTQLNSQEPLALTYSSAPLRSAVNVAGPASLDLYVATALPADDLWAVLADVWPDGHATAVGVGRLRSAYPGVDRQRSVIDQNGEIVQPYGDYSDVQPALPLQTREYHIEFWPVGNRFPAGHRLRLYLVGVPLYTVPLPGVNLVSIGGATPSRLLLPVAPGGDLAAALQGQAP
ncbi:MAG TPA: CocE/NonD family hydrolase [Nevskia sp.]|nr:CocE/NonD family hydrolase [Nevskia sp.]